MTSDDAQKLVEQGMARLMADPQEWERWAKTLSRFTKYSPGNALLIMVQCPDATYVAGYKAWQSLGRQVERGQKALTILAPVTKKVEPRETTDPEKPERKLVGFRTASVFDIGQTTGQPLHIPQPTPLTGDRMAQTLHRLIPLVGHPVRFGDTGEAFGYWSPSEGQIVIRHDAPPNHQFKTLLHEWSHSLGVRTVQEAADRHRGTEEIIAETTAYVAAGALGLDTTEYSKGYVGSWAEGDPKAVAAATQAIGQRVHAIIATIERAAEKDPALQALTAPWQPLKPPPEESPQRAESGGRGR